MTMRPSIFSCSIRWKISLIASSGSRETCDFTFPSPAKARHSARSCRVPTIDPRTVIRLSTVWKIGSGKSPGGRPSDRGGGGPPEGGLQGPISGPIHAARRENDRREVNASRASPMASSPASSRTLPIHLRTRPNSAPQGTTAPHCPPEPLLSRAHSCSQPSVAVNRTRLLTQACPSWMLRFACRGRLTMTRRRRRALDTFRQITWRTNHEDCHRRRGSCRSHRLGLLRSNQPIERARGLRFAPGWAEIRGAGAPPPPRDRSRDSTPCC